MRGSRSRIRATVFVGVCVGMLATVSGLAQAGTQVDHLTVKKDTFISQVVAEQGRGDMKFLRVNGAPGSEKIAFLDFGSLKLDSRLDTASLVLNIDNAPESSMTLTVSNVDSFDVATATYSNPPKIKNKITTVNVKPGDKAVTIRGLGGALKAGSSRFAISTSDNDQAQFTSLDGAKFVKDGTKAARLMFTYKASTTSTSKPDPTTTTTIKTTTTTIKSGGGGLDCAKADQKTLTGKQDSAQFGSWFVNQDVWTGAGQQTMTYCSPSNWMAMANQAGPPSSGVKTYPDSEKRYTTWSGNCDPADPKINTFNKITSTFGQTAPSKGTWDYGYDVYADLNCGRKLTEIMVWTQYNADECWTGNCQDITIGGVTYTFSKMGDTEYVFALKNQKSSGSVDLMAIMNYMQDPSHTWTDASGKKQPFPLTQASTLKFIQYGVEVLETGGGPLPFYLNDFTVTDK